MYLFDICAIVGYFELVIITVGRITFFELNTECSANKYNIKKIENQNQILKEKIDQMSIIYTYPSRIQTQQYKLEDRLPEQKRENNKKVFSNLKEQMSIIREGMNKLIKVKSQENMKISQLSKSFIILPQAQDEKINNYKNSQINQSYLQAQNIQIKQRLKILEDQNKTLKEKLGFTEDLLKMERGTFTKRIYQLQAQNEMANEELTRTLNQIQKLRILIKRSRKQSSRKSLNRSYDDINPEVQIQPIIKNNNANWINYANQLKQVNNLKKTIQKLEKQLDISQTIKNEYEKLNSELNQKIIHLEFKNVYYKSKLTRKFDYIV